MNSSVIQLLVLAGIAVFLILRLKNVLGTRDGFEKPPVDLPTQDVDPTPRDFQVIEGGPDPEVADFAEDGSDAAEALTAMKRVEPHFSIATFLEGAKGAYEMILMAYEKGTLDDIKPFLAEEVYDSFQEAVAAREKQGLTVDANFVGVRELTIDDATFSKGSNIAEISIRFVGELTSVVRNDEGEVVEGSPTDIKRQRDVWTFGREMGANDPNWQLVATGG